MHDAIVRVSPQHQLVDAFSIGFSYQCARFKMQIENLLRLPMLLRLLLQLRIYGSQADSASDG